MSQASKPAASADGLAPQALGETPAPNTQCARCDARMHCGAALGQCWCQSVAPVTIDAGWANCLCAACLAEVSKSTSNTSHV